jgi:AmmeMemoRadiSam system protein A
MSESHPLVKLAQEAIECWIRDGVRIRPPVELAEGMRRRAGAFVTLHLRGQLRGCIGTIQPVYDNVAAEVIQNAISAATRDPRFLPVRRDELAGLNVKVDVLAGPEPVESLEELDPKRYGLIVQSKSDPLKRVLTQWRSRSTTPVITRPGSPTQTNRWRCFALKLCAILETGSGLRC